MTSKYEMKQKFCVQKDCYMYAITFNKRNSKVIAATAQSVNINHKLLYTSGFWELCSNGLYLKWLYLTS